MRSRRALVAVMGFMAVFAVLLGSASGLTGANWADAVYGEGELKAGLAYGSWHDETSLRIYENNTVYPFQYKTADFTPVGISIVDNTKITVANAGIYNIQFSAQLHNDVAGTIETSIWLRKNGTTVAWTATDTPMGKDTFNKRRVAAWNFLVAAAAGDYFEIVIAASGIDTGKCDASTQNACLYVWAGTSGVTLAPSIPSVILTVDQVG